MAKRTLPILSLLAAAILFGHSGPATAAQPNWPESITIATASEGGTYQAYGAALARILTRSLGVTVGTQTTEGPAENIRLLEAGKVDIGFVTMGTALAAWSGELPGDAKTYRSFRALFPMYETAFHFLVPKESKAARLSDLGGKRLGVGPREGTSGTYMPRILSTLKVDAVSVPGSYADLSAQLKDGGIDGLAGAAGVPFPAIDGLDARKAIRYITLDRSEIASVRLAIPELMETTIPAGSYPSLTSHYRTLGMFNFAVIRQNLPADLATAIVEAVFANREELMESQPAAVGTIPTNYIHNTFLPYHTGAAKYYRGLIQAGTLATD